MKVEDLNYKRSWVKRYRSEYAIEILHEKRDTSDPAGRLVNWWALYVYVYPNHPLIDAAPPEGQIYGNVVSDMPLHCGCSLVRWHHDKSGTPNSVQIGCDYHHYGDEFYEEEDRLERTGILDDAQKLVEWLDEYARTRGGGK